MRSEITIENFRGIAQGSLADLAPLTVLLGPNNSGKSTVLEALRFGGDEPAARVAAELVTRRGWGGFGCIEQLAYHWDKPFKITAKADDRGMTWEISRLTSVDTKLARVLGTDLAPKVGDELASGDFVGILASQGFQRIAASQGLRRISLAVVGRDGTTKVVLENQDIAIGPPSHLIDPDTITRAGLLEEVFSTATARGKEQELEALLAQIEPTGPALRILKKGDRFVLHTVTSERAVPVYLGGHGFKRLLFMAFGLVAHAGELVLLEEPECFQHKSSLNRLAALIWSAVDTQTQVIISTHSPQLLKFLLTAEDVPLEKAAVFHTRLEGGVLTAVRLGGKEAANRLDEIGEISNPAPPG